MKNKSNKNIDIQGTVTLYYNTSDIDLYSSSIVFDSEIMNCRDLDSIIDNNIIKYSKAWEGLSKL